MKKRGVSFFAGIDTLVGWYGMTVILAAYALVSFGVLKADSLVYQVLNLTGALGIAVISMKKKALQPAILNMVWAVVALLALSSMFWR
jgi:hypothetical protein